MVWSIREIAQGIVACGFINKGTVELYEGGTCIGVVYSNIQSFGFILAPSWDPTWSTEVNKNYPKLIALDNMGLVCIDLVDDSTSTIT